MAALLRFGLIGCGDFGRHLGRYILEVGDFARWVQEGRPPCLTWVEGLRCVELMEAAYRSAEAGGQVVELPLYPELELR